MYIPVVDMMSMYFSYFAIWLCLVCLAAYYRIIRIHFGSIVLFMGFPNPGIYIFRDLLKCSLYSIRTSESTKLYCNEPLENSQSMKVGSHKSDWFHIMCVYRQLKSLVLFTDRAGPARVLRVEASFPCRA